MRFTKQMIISLMLCFIVSISLPVVAGQYAGYTGDAVITTRKRQEADKKPVFQCPKKNEVKKTGLNNKPDNTKNSKQTGKPVVKAKTVITVPEKPKPKTEKPYFTFHGKPLPPPSRKNNSNSCPSCGPKDRSKGVAHVRHKEPAKLITRKRVRCESFVSGSLLILPCLKRTSVPGLFKDKGDVGGGGGAGYRYYYIRKDNGVCKVTGIDLYGVKAYSASNLKECRADYEKYAIKSNTFVCGNKKFVIK